MADKIPVKARFTGPDVTALQEFEPTDTIALSIISGFPTGVTLELGNNSINTLQDVDVPTPANNEVLTFNSGTGNWEAATPTVPVHPVAITPIAGDDVPTFIDSTRANKILSTALVTMVSTGNKVVDLTWFKIDQAKNNINGHVFLHNSTIVGLAAQFRNGKGRDLDLYINDVLVTPSIAILPNVTDARITDSTLNIDVAAGDKVQIRGGTNGVNQTSRGLVTIYSRWRS